MFFQDGLVQVKDLHRVSLKGGVLNSDLLLFMQIVLLIGGWIATDSQSFSRAWYCPVSKWRWFRPDWDSAVWVQVHFSFPACSFVPPPFTAATAPESLDHLHHTWSCSLCYFWPCFCSLCKLEITSFFICNSCRRLFTNSWTMFLFLPSLVSSCLICSVMFPIWNPFSFFFLLLMKGEGLVRNLTDRFFFILKSSSSWIVSIRLPNLFWDLVGGTWGNKWPEELFLQIIFDSSECINYIYFNMINRFLEGCFCCFYCLH